MARFILLSAIGLAALLVAGAILIDPPRSDARVEFQTGSIQVQIASPDAILALAPDTACWVRGCPLFSVRARLFSAAPQGAESESRRVQRLPSVTFER